MNALITLLALLLTVAITFLEPAKGAAALLFCAALALPVGILVSRINDKFLLRVFIFGLLVRVVLATIINLAKLEGFFGGDAFTYDYQGFALLNGWVDKNQDLRNWGMSYMVAGIYAIVGRNMLAVQLVNSVIGAATSAVIYICARHIFQNLRVARIAAVSVAFYPSLIVWSAQGLKDGPVVFMLTIVIMATLRLSEKTSAKYITVLGVGLLGILSFRFYIFYMLVVACGGSLLIGMQRAATQNFLKQFIVVIVIGLGLTYFGVTRTASVEIEQYGNLETVQRSRLDLAQSAGSGFGQDVDVSTTTGAISVIPLGLVYLLFAPFPWQLASLRQSITLPEMIIWWASFPLLIIGIWFTLKYRLRQALPIVIFTSLLTLAYSIFQGNIGTAYRQRAQLLVFYFIFVAVGYVLLMERREKRKQDAVALKQEAVAKLRAHRAQRSYGQPQRSLLEKRDS